MDVYIVMRRVARATEATTDATEAGDADRPAEVPVVLRDGFSWPAFLFGPLWLLWHRMWMEAAVFAGLWLIAMLLPLAIAAVAGLLLSLLLGLEGNTLRRLALQRRGYRREQVVLAPDATTALQQALQAAPAGSGGVAAH